MAFIKVTEDNLQLARVCGFPCGLAGKESACNVGDPGLIPGLGRSPGEGKGSLLQYSCLENSMDCRVHGVTKSWTRRERLSLPESYCGGPLPAPSGVLLP